MAKGNQRVVECTQEIVDSIKNDLRAMDEYECLASSGHGGDQALQNGLDNALFIKAIEVDEKPVAVYGVSPYQDDPNAGVVWLLGTDDTAKAKDVLIRNGKDLVDEMLGVRPHLFNYVSIKNKVSIKWLKSLGFTMSSPTPYGVKQDLFCFFSKSKEVQHV
jgi:hypothetical protein